MTIGNEKTAASRYWHYQDHYIPPCDTSLVKGRQEDGDKQDVVRNIRVSKTESEENMDGIN